MTEIQNASEETINKVKDGWNKVKLELFSRNGIAPNGRIGQDFVNNPPLQSRVDKIAELYIPTIARMIELDDKSRIIGKEIESQKNISQTSDPLTSWKKSFDEIEILRNRSTKLMPVAIGILQAEDSGLNKECARRKKTTESDIQAVAREIVGSCIQFLLKGAGCEQKGLIPKPPSSLAYR